MKKFFAHIIDNNFDSQVISDLGYRYQNYGYNEPRKNPNYWIIKEGTPELLKSEFDELDEETQVKLFEYLCKNAHLDAHAYSRDLLPRLDVSKAFLENFYRQAKDNNLVIKSNEPGRLFADIAYYLSPDSKANLMSIINENLSDDDLFVVFEGVYSHANVRESVRDGIVVAPEALYYFKELVNRGHSKQIYNKLIEEENGKEKIIATLSLLLDKDNQTFEQFLSSIPQIPSTDLRIETYKNVSNDNELNALNYSVAGNEVVLSKPNLQIPDDMTNEALVANIKKSTEDYLAWMKDNAAGTRGITRFKHFFHGDSGEKRASNILRLIDKGESPTDILEAVSKAVKDSGTANHSYSRYVCDAIMPTQKAVDNKNIDFSQVKSVLISELDSRADMRSSSGNLLS